jgi:hypothetical protein
VPLIAVRAGRLHVGDDRAVGPIGLAHKGHADRLTDEARAAVRPDEVAAPGGFARSQRGGHAFVDLHEGDEFRLQLNPTA